MRYYISDMHFYHENLIKGLDNRKFDSLEAMHEYMIGKWNARVRRNDEVVILGDFSIGKAEETMEILRQLKGKKYLIVGNHDRYLTDKKFDASLFQWVHPYKELNDNGRKVILSHYPTFCYNEQNHVNKNGRPKTYMLYGHVHNTVDEMLVNSFINQTKQEHRRISEVVDTIPCNMINCFCMFSDYTPLTLDEWIEVDEKRRAGLNS